MDSKNVEHQTSVVEMQSGLLARNKWSYSLGGIGRDMIYQLVATFFITYIQFALDLTPEQFSVIGLLLVLGRVFDAINDPIMGGIVENTRSRWGKFKPWILIGALLTGVAVILMFNFRPEGWSFVIFFGIIYFLWVIFFTLNDIPYWSLLPNLAKDKKDRDTLTMMVVVFAALGAFAANAVISLYTVGNALEGYATISIIFVIVFLACTFLTVFGVKEPKQEKNEDDKVSVKGMFKTIKNNDQLLWAALALLLYTIGSNLLVALGYNFFYMELGYNGLLVTIFVLTFGVSTILVQSFYPALAKKSTRRKLMTVSIAIIALGYLLFFLQGYLPFIPVSLVTVCIFGALVFGGQAIFYMVTIVNLTNTIEYNEYKSGKRNEAVIFSLRPFVTKLASALQQGVVTLVLVASGIYALSQNVSSLEIQKEVFDNLTVTEQVEYKADILARTDILDDYDITEDVREALYDALQYVTYEDVDEDGVEELVINEAANQAFKEKVTGSMRITMRLAITLLPVILIASAYFIFSKKYIITEEYYDMMLEEIEEKKKQIE